MKMKVVGSLVVSAALLCCATNLAAKSEAVENGSYTSKDKEFYLTPEQLLFIRPGLEIEILNVEIPADMQLEVTYSIKDPAGLGLDHDGIYTPGATDMRFVLANIPMDQEQKTQLAYERIGRGDGTLTPMGDGVYKYKFETALTSNQDTTHTLLLGGRRDLREFDLDRYADNALYDWVPSGMYDAVPRDIVSAASCNRCHDPLQEHGRWQSPNACSQCHTPDLVDDGVSYSLDQFIHRAHIGLEGYPTAISNCEVCHTGGIPTENFPLVATPNPVLVCDGSSVGTAEISWGDVDEFEIHMNTADGPLFVSGGGAGSAPTGKWVGDGTVFVLVDKATGETIQTLPVSATVLGCVGNAPGTFKGEAASQHTNWLDHPSRAVCGSCHSNIDFENGVGHIAQSSDEICGNCHRPGLGQEFNRSVRGAHLALYKSEEFPGALFEFVDIMDTDPGDKPTVMFKLGSKYGGLDANNMNRLRLAITGPNEDYDVYIQETVSNASLNGDVWSYTFNTAIPADAEGSYTVSVEGRADATVDGSNERDVIESSSMAFAVTGNVAARRVVVDDAKCESCHDNLSLHGGGRNNANYCTTCHAPEATDEEEVQPGNHEQSIHFKYMVHKIHRGEDLENGYVAAGHNQSIHDYSDVEYPGDLRNCDACHVNDSQLLPLPQGVLATVTPQDWWTPTAPKSAACLSCHDGDDAAVHAYTNTAMFGESCSTCHGEGKEYAVEKVHAR
jgi:hypothetical protein